MAAHIRRDEAVDDREIVYRVYLGNVIEHHRHIGQQSNHHAGVHSKRDNRAEGRSNQCIASMCDIDSCSLLSTQLKLIKVDHMQRTS